MRQSSKSKYDYRSPNNRKSVSKSDKKESKAIKRDKIDVMNDKKSSKSKVKDIINGEFSKEKEIIDYRGARRIRRIREIRCRG